MGASMRTPEYIQNYFASIKRISKPPDARNLKYTVDIPLKRPDILPKEILQLASPVNFEKISASKSFEIEKELLKGIRHFWSHEKVINGDSLLKIFTQCDFQGLLCREITPYSMHVNFLQKLHVLPIE